MKKKITIVDYGSGNIFSAHHSFLKVIKENLIDADIAVSNDPKVMTKKITIR